MGQNSWEKFLAALGSVGGSEFNAESVIQKIEIEDINLTFTYIGLIVSTARNVWTLHILHFMTLRVIIEQWESGGC